jgi:deoxyribodipyrimidine photo-lyase
MAGIIWKALSMESAFRPYIAGYAQATTNRFSIMFAVHIRERFGRRAHPAGGIVRRVTTPAVLWFRRDLRLSDHPALAAAAEGGRPVLGLFVLDPTLLKPAGPARLAFLYRCLRELDRRLGGRLVVVRGHPVRTVARVAGEVGAEEVHVSTDLGPYGRERDHRVGREVRLVATGSPYAVTPGRIATAEGTPYRVFTPFYRAWLEHGWRDPAPEVEVDWVTAKSVDIPKGPDLDLPEAGESAALALWQRFLAHGLARYHEDRDRPDRDGTTRLSPYLRFGCVHPRTLLADLAHHRGAGVEALRSELAWREFYADVLWHRPDTARRNLDTRFDRMPHTTGKAADDLFEAWATGRTGYPIVDAGMRQLLAEGWLHNRVRMIVASFLVKDLHLPWWRGARYFMRHLVDGDLASNQHNWQWVAGCGTDAAPYFRVFNPIRQGEKFDPDGDYVRRYVPELRGVDDVHRLGGDRPAGYPPPVVDHAHERQLALEHYARVKNG